jgi:hypothetical protein
VRNRSGGVKVELTSIPTAAWRMLFAIDHERSVSVAVLVVISANLVPLMSTERRTDTKGRG